MCDEQGRNQVLVTYERVEFEEKPAEVQDVENVTHQFRGI
jgi:hypothetical protein